ncbi:MAG: hypothetical protein J7513_10540 [Solirubrobacteraceae bacterium]|nr:hypothetical protein [Solirubrobacteraceae bacterium]
MPQRLLLLAAALFVALPSAASAAPIDAGGRADFAIASRSAKTLKKGKVKMTAVGGAASSKKAWLPVASATSTSAVLSGSLKLKRGKKVLKLEKLTLDGQQGLLYAKVGNAKNVPIFLVDTARSKEQVVGVDSLYGPFRVKLSAIGASVFASRLGVKPGTGGSFATLRITLQRAATRITLDPAFTAAMAGIGAKVSPASDTREGTAGLYVPVSADKGKVSLTAPIAHSGGLALDAPTALLMLDKLIVDPAAGVISAETAATTRANVFTVDKAAAKTTRRGSQLVITGLKLALSPDGANAINATFGVTSFVAGSPVGTATIIGTR